MSKKEIIHTIYGTIAGETGLQPGEIFLIFLGTIIVAVYIFLVYKNANRTAFYSKDLNITMAGTTIVVAAIMVAMQANLIVSLGMVGALSIVRFRTAIKNPLDLLYLFWSISSGIICGVGLYGLAIGLCAIMTILIFSLSKVHDAKAPAIVIVRCDISACVDEIEKTIHSFVIKGAYHLTSDSIRNNQRELIYEISIIEKTALVTELSKITGINAVNCLEHDGEVRG